MKKPLSILEKSGWNRYLPSWIIKRIYLEDMSIINFIAGETENMKEDSLVLDAGAGRCQYRSLFREHRYFSMDNTEGENKWDYSSLNVISDLEQIPFPSETFDVVLLTQVLEHVRRPLEVLKEIRRVLKKNGKLLLTAPQGWKEHQKPQDFFRFTTGSLEYLFSESGYSKWEIEKRGGYFRFLGAQLRDMPEIIFGSFLKRWWMFPIRLIFEGLFMVMIPFICYYLDGLDKKRDYTNGYKCVIQKG